ncbi:kelch-like protein 32 [Thamnophis elegans]|uniref:kelch-like protein 32 n=1 Tax=Thamnophis elegans TaxID=35005 RepID=UPI001378E412|nr:kelch-like protein 32 [Thamnophis elegans]
MTESWPPHRLLQHRCDQWTRCHFSMLTGQNESGVAVHNGRIYLVGGYSIWTNEPSACIQVLDVVRKEKKKFSMGLPCLLLQMELQPVFFPLLMLHAQTCSLCKCLIIRWAML